MFETLDILIKADYTGLKSGIESSLSFIEKSFSNIKTGKIDLSKVISADFFTGINWTSLIGKLFSPANLVAFFSAMAAMGITTAISQQAATTTTPVGAGLTPAQRTDLTDVANQIATQTGQSADDIITAIEQLIPALGGNVDAAKKLGLQMAEVAATTGESLPSLAGAFAPLLQTLGISDLGSATTLLTSFDNAAIQSGQTVDTLVKAFQQFAPMVKASGLSIDGINHSIQQFGASVQGAGLEGATAAFNTFFQVLSRANDGAIALGGVAGGVGKLKNEVESGNVSQALNNISDAVSNLTQKGQLSLLGPQFSTSAEGLAAMIGQLTAYPIQTQETITQRFNDTDTALREFNKTYNEFKALTSVVVGAPLLAFLTSVLQLLNAIMDPLDTFKSFLSLFQDTLSPNGGSNAVSTPQLAPNVSPLWSAFTVPGTSLNKSNAGGSNMSNMTISQFFYVSGSSSSVSQTISSATSSLQNLVNGHTSGAGTGAGSTIYHGPKS